MVHSAESTLSRDPGNPVVKILCFQCRGHRFHPWSRKLRSYMLSGEATMHTHTHTHTHNNNKQTEYKVNLIDLGHTHSVSTIGLTVHGVAKSWT